jgi:Peroxidase, family 2
MAIIPPDAMANHGILPRDGRNITKGMFNKALEDTWNFAPTLTRNTTNAAANLFGRSTLDLADLAGHNIIEHDASLLRTLKMLRLSSIWDLIPNH